MPELAQIVSGRKESSFYDNACKEWEEHGARKMSNMRNQYSSFYLELPG